MRASTRAPAKVNLCLLVGPTRPHDGRHELVTVFQALDLADDVTLGPAAGDVDESACVPPLDDPADDLARRAIDAFRAATGWDGPPVRAEVRKRIPVAGGMAGGSSDAAAVLRLLARETGLTDGRDELHRVAARLGADVPALVEPGRWIGTGAGEVLERVPDPAPEAFSVVLVTSDEGLSTPAVFREADRLGLPRGEAALAEGLAAVRARAGDLPPALCVNDLQAAALSLRPDLEATLGALTTEGADVAIVSGSGPTCAGLFGDRPAAEAAATALAERFPGHVLLAGPHVAEHAGGAVR